MHGLQKGDGPRLKEDKHFTSLIVLYLSEGCREWDKEAILASEKTRNIHV